MTLVVNLYGGPGVGKSTTAAEVFVRLKKAHVNCELVQEYAKDLVWEGRHKTLGNQVYLLGKQYQRIFRLLDQVDVIITDSPLPLMLHYGAHEPEAFHDLVTAMHRSLTNLDFFIIRDPARPYQTSGRLQTHDEAVVIDNEIRSLMIRRGLSYVNVPFASAAEHITAEVLRCLTDA